MTVLHVEVIDSLAEVARSQWNNLVGPTAFYQSYDWLRGQEEWSDAEPCYALARRAGILVGAMVAFEYRRDSAFITWPNRNALLIGGRTGYHNEHLIDGDTGVLPALLAAMAERATAGGRDALMFDNLTGEAAEQLLAASTGVLTARRVEAVVVNPGATFDSYLDGLSRLRAKEVRREERRFDASGIVLGRERLAEVYEEASPLLVQTMHRYHAEASVSATSAFLAEQARFVDEHSIVFTGRDAAGRLLGCVITFEHGPTLYLRSAGFDYDRLPGAYEYFNLAYYKPLRYGEAAGLTGLHLGSGSLATKVSRGARLAPTFGVEFPVPLRPGSLTWDRSALVGEVERLSEGCSAALDPTWRRWV